VTANKQHQLVVAANKQQQLVAANKQHQLVVAANKQHQLVVTANKQHQLVTANKHYLISEQLLESVDGLLLVGEGQWYLHHFLLVAGTLPARRLSRGSMCRGV